MMSVCNFVGKDRQGRDFTTLFFSAGGFGALKGLDGTAATPAPSNMMVMPTETWEAMTGLRIISRSLRADSGGPGQFRGGLGQRIVLANETGNPATVFTMGTRTEFPAQGVCGGLAGGAAKIFYQRQGDPSKGMLRNGSRGCLRVIGGRRWRLRRRDERDRLSIESDINHGFLTRAAAERDYFYQPL